MVILNKDNFEKEVLQSQGLVVVDFWGQRCEPCKALMPQFETLASKYEDKAKFCKLDTTGNKRLAISQKVLGLPAIVLYKDGEKVSEFVKEFNIEEVEEKVIKLIR